MFHGRVSTEDWQDPVTSRVRQREQAETLIRGYRHVVAEFFDQGESRTVAWGRRPQAAAEDVICYLHEQRVTLTCDPATGTLRAGIGQVAQTITPKAS